MVEFLQNYWLWIVLAGVFFAMHRFGMGCCGTMHHRKLPEHDRLPHDENTTDGRASKTASRSDGGYH